MGSREHRLWLAEEVDRSKYGWLLSQQLVFLLLVPSPVFIQAASLAPCCLYALGNLAPPRVLEVGYLQAHSRHVIHSGHYAESSPGEF